ncbi:MAG: hypothetical protein K0R14_231 [Burkholderiales bacterium]|jgi:hypothetical protein|nr:hypothetical protein [Burkholderiales bacterium]
MDNILVKNDHMFLLFKLILVMSIWCTTVYALADKLPVQSISQKTTQNYTYTKQAIILNTQIDDIQQLDPRLKSIIMYVHYKPTPVYIYYFSEDSKRYTMKLLDLFKVNKVNSVFIQGSLSTNLIEHNLIKIYLGESQNVLTVNK